LTVRNHPTKRNPEEFRKDRNHCRIFPGLALNLSKSGISASSRGGPRCDDQRQLKRHPGEPRGFRERRTRAAEGGNDWLRIHVRRKTRITAPKITIGRDLSLVAPTAGFFHEGFSNNDGSNGDPLGSRAEKAGGPLSAIYDTRVWVFSRSPEILMSVGSVPP
jgi:hypothetical protein